jgi:hypothetical protein
MRDAFRFIQPNSICQANISRQNVPVLFSILYSANIITHTPPIYTQFTKYRRHCE